MERDVMKEEKHTHVWTYFIYNYKYLHMFLYETFFTGTKLCLQINSTNKLIEFCLKFSYKNIQANVKN